MSPSLGSVTSEQVKSSFEKVLTKVLPHLTLEEQYRARAVCKQWKELVHLYLEEEEKNHPEITSCISDSNTYFPPILQRFEILDKIFTFLSTRTDRCSYRQVCLHFYLVANFRVNFYPVLTDTTRSSILRMSPDVKVREIRVEDLYLPLPVDEDGLLEAELAIEKIQSLCFHDGVSSWNKSALLRSFPNLQELKYSWSSTYAFPPGVSFSYLRYIHIQGIAQKDNGSLENFFAQACFPQLKHINVELHFRRDLMLYIELHKFIAFHHTTLEKLELDFKCYFYPEESRENAGGMLVLLSNDLLQHYNEIVVKLKLTRLESLAITFLDYEGTSLFHLGFTLLLAQRHLKSLRISKEYTKTRREFLPLYKTIQRNEGTLEELSMPHPYSFNCSTLHACKLLEALTIGQNWGSRYQDSHITHVEMLPQHKSFRILRMSIRLRFTQIHWILQHLELQVLEFRGCQGEPYNLGNIQNILRRQPSLQRLELECEMTIQEYKLIKIYFTWTAGIKMEWSHFESCEDLLEEYSHRGEFHVILDRKVLTLKPAEGES